MTDKIFVALSTFAEYGHEPLKLLEESGIEYFLNPLGRRVVREEIVQMGNDATGIIAGVEPYDIDVLDSLPVLKCISRCGVGTDNIDMDSARRKGIVIRNTPDVVIQPVVELTLAMIFDLMRKLSLHTHHLKQKKWIKIPGSLLKSKKVGILGLGRIGKRVAEALLALKIDVIGTDLNPDSPWAQNSGVLVVPIQELLNEADIVSLHISSDKEHPFFIDSEHIAMMKPGAWLVNTSRGNLIDDKAVATALNSGHLSGAAFDVFPQEPYDGILCDQDNVIMTPHVATLTRESRLQMEIETVQNLLGVLTA